ncbi:hypothetical protein SQ11_00245 [Nitrosospira sp. NpAV]|nr:hypothetical protein SQ11_00245 [Nitrosospira sp. NpAV]
MTILYLEDAKKFRTKIGPAKDTVSVGAAGGLRESERKALWSDVFRCFQLPLNNARRSVRYSPSSKWLPEHTSQWLESVRDGR